jgi:hypothetical protein
VAWPECLRKRRFGDIRAYEHAYGAIQVSGSRLCSELRTARNRLCLSMLMPYTYGVKTALKTAWSPSDRVAGGGGNSTGLLTAVPIVVIKQQRNPSSCRTRRHSLSNWHRSRRPDNNEKSATASPLPAAPTRAGLAISASPSTCLATIADRTEAVFAESAYARKASGKRPSSLVNTVHSAADGTIPCPDRSCSAGFRRYLSAATHVRLGPHDIVMPVVILLIS